MTKKNTGTENKEEVALINAVDQARIQAKKLLISETNATPAELKKLQDTYGKMKIKNIDDLSGYNFVVQGSKDLKKLRTTIATKRKNLTEPALVFQKEMIATEKEILDVIQPLEDALKAKKIDFEDKVKAAKHKLFKERTEKLNAHGYQLNGEFYVCSAINIEAAKIADLSNDDFDFYLQQGLAEMERIAAEEKRKKDEADALKKEREEMAAEKEKMRLEREAMAKEKEELAAQKLALEETYGKVEKPSEEIVVDVSKEHLKNIASAKVENPLLADADVMLSEKELEKTITIEKGPAIGKSTTSISQKPEDATGSVEESQLEVGFNEMRKRVIELVSDNSIKISRNGLIKWAEEQKLV